MERSTVHVAVLVVAEDPASVDLANATFMSDKATGAGHRIVAQEIVEDDEAAIRDQLTRWLGQPHIDVILSAGADDAAAVALGPLVTKPLPGLTDQLRLLARDRGSSSRPVAARCASKFVFLLPPEIAALGPALNQLVLPQLDSTAERNLVKEMPRHGGEAVPQAVAAEKTVTGAGVAPKIPAEPRGKRKTGANVVARNEARQQAAAAQDATRQIDRFKLEQQLARSASAHDAATRPHIDLATMLPSVPGDRADTEEELPALDGPTRDDPTLENPTTPAVRTVQPARLRGPGPIGTAKSPAQPSPAAVTDEAPTARKSPASAPVAAKPITPVTAKPVASAPVAAKPTTPVAAKPIASAPVAAKPTTPVAAKPAASTPVAAKPSASAAVAASAKALELPKPTPVSGVTTATPPTGNRLPVAPTPAAAGTRGPAQGQARAAHGSPPPVGEIARDALEAAAAEEAIDAASSADILEAASADFEEVSTPPSPSRIQAAPVIPGPRAASSSSPPAIPTRQATGPAPVVPPRPATGPAPVVPRRPATGPAPVVPPRPATGPAPVVPQRPATGPAPVVPQRPATGPVPLASEPPVPFTGPELLDLREGSQKKRRSRTGTALVRENKRAPILMYLALAGAAVAGFFAVVHFFPQGGDSADRPGSGAGSTVAAVASPTPPAPPPAPPLGSADPAGSAEPAGSAVAAGSATAPQAAGTAASPSGSAAHAPEHATAPANPAPPPTTHATGHDQAAHHTPAAPSGTPVTHPDTKPDTHADPAKPDTATDTAAKTGPPAPPAEDGCDEVSCVMEHYERACCARFKPSDSGFHPKGTVPDQLDKAMVKAGIEKVKPTVVACGEKIAAKGTVKLAITVAPEGNVKDISVADSPDPALGDCVLGAVKHAQFGKSVNGASFTYPFVF